MPRPRTLRRLRSTAHASATEPGSYAPRRRVNERPTKWDTGEFVAVDGEGFSEGPVRSYVVGQKHTHYMGKDHNYAYLSASDGSSLYSPSGRLSICDCLSFLCNIKLNNPNSVIVVFGGSYDCTHWATHHFGPDEIAALLGKHPKFRTLLYTNDEFSYSLEYRPRKCFTIRRWERGEARYGDDGRGGRKLTPHLLVQVWDVWGFFQASFVEVMRKWLPGDPDYLMISRMKGDRSIFERAEIDQIKIYNAAELRCLVKIMEAVRSAISDLGLTITRWDGAGAIAASMMRKHRVKDHMKQPPREVFDAARIAYSGGHIETCKMGYHNGKVHHYDINSAYPAQFRRLPSLSSGRWVRGTGSPLEGFTIVHMQYRFLEGLPFYPLFFRTGGGGIIYPSSGRGWYWMPEYTTAKMFHEKFGGPTFEVFEWWSYIPDHGAGDGRPFQWVEDYYRARQDYIREARAQGVENGPEKIIKLGCNSLYGKTAQQVGARIDKDGDLRLPSYFQLEWAGYVTSGCRSVLMGAAIGSSDSIIGFATDGIFSTAPLDLYCPTDKDLGAWEYTVHDGLTMVMPGVYWLHDGGKVKHYSRGFNKREMSDVEFIHDAWKRKEESVAISIERLIGLGSAISSREYWKMRGNFMTSKRILKLNGDNSKRYPISLHHHKPHLRLVDTIPRSHMLHNDLWDLPMSAPYPIAWLDGTAERDDPDGEYMEDDDIIAAELA